MKNRKKTVLIISIIIVILLGFLQNIFSENVPIYLRKIKKYYEGNPNENILNLGKDGEGGPCITNFQFDKGKFYYLNSDGKLCRFYSKEKRTEKFSKIVNPFWVVDESIFFVASNNIMKYDLQPGTKKIILSDILGEYCVDVEDGSIFYFSKSDYCLHSYNMETEKIKNYNIEYRYMTYFGVLNKNLVLGSKKHMFLYNLETMAYKEIKNENVSCFRYIAKTKNDLFFCVLGHEIGDIMTKKDWGDNGVYRVDFEKMELEKISGETYDWIFANSDKLYGVKQKMWGLYSTIEEVKYNESKK